VLRLPSNVPPWTRTGLRVASGDALTLLAQGRVVLSEELDVWGGPGFHLWGRIGPGPIFNGARDTNTIECSCDGELELAVYTGEWATPTGELATPVEGYASLGGAIEVLALHWRVDPVEGLHALQARSPDEPLLEADLRRLASPVRRPAGWRLLWFLGESDSFSQVELDGRPAISVDTRGDVAILQRPVDFALEPDTTLEWRWRVSELPAREREDHFHTHDYVSIAIEFENGLDLTWYWSAELPSETSYACPLPTWAERETHLVVRSGSADLGRWLSERRDVRADYATCVGDPPARIVAVWLIAVSLFQRRRGRADFADIVLRRGDAELRVL
jgi:hypothetical protein